MKRAKPKSAKKQPNDVSTSPTTLEPRWKGIVLSEAFERVAAEEGGHKNAGRILRGKIINGAIRARARDVLRDGHGGPRNEPLTPNDWHAANVDWNASYFLRLPTSRIAGTNTGGEFVALHFSDTDAALPISLPATPSYESLGHVEAHGIELRLDDFAREFPYAKASLPPATEAAPNERRSGSTKGEGRTRGVKVKFDWHVVVGEFVRHMHEKGPPSNDEAEAKRLLKWCLDHFQSSAECPTQGTLRKAIGIWLKPLGPRRT
jgi:hypothetical protein